MERALVDSSMTFVMVKLSASEKSGSVLGVGVGVRLFGEVFECVENGPWMAGVTVGWAGKLASPGGVLTRGSGFQNRIAVMAKSPIPPIAICFPRACMLQ